MALYCSLAAAEPSPTDPPGAAQSEADEERRAMALFDATKVGKPYLSPI